MLAALIENEAQVRLFCFFGILTAMWLWQTLLPKRTLSISPITRWSNNLALVFFNSAVLRLLFPLATVGVATWAQQHQFGLFNLIVLPLWLEILLVVVLLDLAIYWQHRIFHKVPFLWRLHRVHHVDQDIDVTTGSRFHTLEIILSMLIKFALVVALGPAVVAVIIFEIILNACAMFNHANARLPIWLDNILRMVLVTPDMHRVHHSTVVAETNSNFGFNLPWWDKMFGSYQDQPKAGHDEMVIGVKEFKNPRQTQYLHHMLMLPFSK